MEVYILEEKEKDKALFLKKSYIDSSKYDSIKDEDSNITLTPKSEKCLTMLTIDEFNFEYSIIMSANIMSANINNEIIEPRPSYSKIINKLYLHIGYGTKIIKHTLLNVKTVEDNKKGYKYIKELGISLQGACSRKQIAEIMNQIVIHKIKAEILIKLKNNTILKFKN